MPTEPFDPVRILDDRFAAAIRRAFPEQAGADPLVAPSKNLKFGDFQCNAAMALGKAIGRNPREVAQAIVTAIGGGLDDLAEPLTDASIAGPGFINITLKPAALASLVSRLDSATLGLDPAGAGERQTVVVDLCGVNPAKEMHVGHIRSVCIGDALARVFERLGHKVIRQNHVGDWGLPIAMVTAKLMELESRGRSTGNISLDELETLYKAAQKECDADERGLAMVRRYDLGPKVEAEIGTQVEEARECLARAKATLVRLQAHDPATVAVWQRISDITMKACLDTCARLGATVLAEHSAGESSYAEELGPMVEELLARRPPVVEESKGALVIRVEGLEEPCIIRKSDGGFLYATTDLAAIRRRVQKLGADRVIYCVDARQGLHFKQVFLAARRVGFDVAPGRSTHAILEHAAFGTILGHDGKPFKTRSGESVKLSELLDEAVERAAKVVDEKSAELPAAERRAIAETVGIGAIKYADLSNDRIKDYVFDFDRMLAFEGNSGPYLLNAAVRIRSIFRKADAGGTALRPSSGEIVIAQKEEKDLALALLRYPGAVRAVAAALEPHRLCQYLFDLASTFSVFYTNCPVLSAPDGTTRASRLRLCAVTQRVLEDGLGLLGIRALERM